MRLSARQAGFTLMETMVAVAVAGLILSFLGFLIWFGSRSAIILHDQVLSQTSAAKASERVSNLMRNAASFKPVLGDDPSAGPFRRLYIEYPDTTHTLASVGNASGRQEIRYYTHKVTSWDGLEPDDDDVEYRFPGLDSFEMLYQSRNRVIVTFRYVYNGFLYIFDRPSIPLSGDYVTECVAKNHFLGRGADSYVDDATTTIISLY